MFEPFDESSMDDGNTDSDDDERFDNQNDPLADIVQTQNDLKKAQANASNFSFGFDGATQSRASNLNEASKRSSTTKKRKSRKRKKTNEPSPSGSGKKTRKTNTNDNAGVDDDDRTMTIDGDSRDALWSKLWKYRKHSKTSHLKSYFDLVNSDSSGEKNVNASCKSCKQVLGITLGNNSNLMVHLQKVCIEYIVLHYNTNSIRN